MHGRRRHFPFVSVTAATRSWKKVLGSLNGSETGAVAEKGSPLTGPGGAAALFPPRTVLSAAGGPALQSLLRTEVRAPALLPVLGWA